MNETTEAINNFRLGLAEAASVYPPQFIDYLADGLYQLGQKWVEEHNAPAEVIRALELGIVLKDYAGDMERGTLLQVFAEDLIVNSVPEATRLIWQLGGSFHDQDGNAAIGPGLSGDGR